MIPRAKIRRDRGKLGNSKKPRYHISYHISGILVFLTHESMENLFSTAGKHQKCSDADYNMDCQKSPKGTIRGLIFM